MSGNFHLRLFVLLSKLSIIVYTYTVLIARLSFLVKSALADAAGILTSKERFRSFFLISLYRNALYLILANALNALLGVVFWIIVARFYNAEDVGLASAAISIILLLVNFSHLGLGLGLIRFLPRSNSDKMANSMINSCFTISMVTSILAAIAFLAGLSFWSPALLFIRQNPVYLVAFIAFTIVFTLSLMTSQTFIAERRAGFVLAKELIFGALRLPLPFLLAAWFYSFGIFASWGGPMVVALAVSLFFFLPRAKPVYRPFLTVRREVVNEMGHFASANYLSQLFQAVPIYILPIMVVNLLGAEPNAFFYVAWTGAGMLFRIPTLTSTSLFAEGSYDEEELGFNTWRSMRLIFILLMPMVIVILVFAPQLLLLFGRDYSGNAATLLRILSISSFPLAVNAVYLAIKQVQMNLRLVIALPAFIAIATLGLSYLLLPRMGINGAGFAWLITQGVVTAGIITNFLWRRR